MSVSPTPAIQTSFHAIEIVLPPYLTDVEAEYVIERIIREQWNNG